jgi:HK97 gp10 family phage protein
MATEVKLSWQGNRVMQKLRTVARAGAEDCAKLIVKEMRRLIIEEGKTGRIYGSHQASAPGEPPANQSGELAKSISYKVVNGANGPEITISVDAKYGGMLELGTRFMEPRPFMRPAVANVSPACTKALAQRFYDATKE